MSTLPRRLSLIAVLSGLVLLGATGCGSSNPNVSAAEDALESNNYEQALRSINTEIQANPQNAAAYRLKGDILYEQARQSTTPERRVQRFADARAAYDEALEIDPGLQGELDLRFLQAYQQEFGQGANAYNTADSLQDAAMFREAAGYFESAAQLRPDSSRAYVLAAESYLNAEDYDRAIDPLTRAVETGNASARTYTTLSQLYLREQRTDDAIAVLEEASERYPDDENLRALRLTAISRSGDSDQAMAEYEEVIRENPENADYRVRYGTMLLQSDRYDEAIEQLQRATELAPNDVGALFNLAAAYRNKSVPLTDRIREMDEERSAQRGELSDQELAEMDNQIRDMIEERKEMFRQAIGPLERAREAYSQDPSATNLTEQQICSALYTAYVQTDQTDRAQEIQDCVGSS